MALTLIKNKKGRVVSVSPERKKYLLAPKVYALKKNGQPKEDSNGEPIPLIKSRDEEGWTDVTPAEAKAFEQELAEAQQGAEEVDDANRAAVLATKTAAKLAAEAGKADQKNVTKKKAAKKAAEDEGAANEAAAALEATVREAEGDAAKYDALTDEGKAKYLELFTDAPEGSK